MEDVDEMYAMSGSGSSDLLAGSSSRRRHRAHTGKYYLSNYLFENDGFLPFLSNSENGYLQRLCDEVSTLSITVPFLT
eukprot:6874441-Heterocapsa_arctica.AAC.1